MIPIGAIIAKKRRAEQEGAGEQPAAGTRRRRANPRRFVNPVSVAAMLICQLAGVGVTAATNQPAYAMAGLAVGLLCLFGIKIAQQWERAVLLRLGRFRALAGPGPFLIIPVVDEVTHLVDQRQRVTDVTAESALTKDTVPVNVDAIVFWTVWDAQKAVLEVQDYGYAVSLSAQTALREAIGRHMLADMITEREQLGKQLQVILDEKTNPWGITVNSVEIRDVKIPEDLEDAMSRQAQAERERQARIILGTAETEISERFVKAGEAYVDNPVGLHLRAMNMLYEAIKEKGSMVIVPSSAVETMGLGGLSGIAALKQQSVTGNEPGPGGR